MMTGGTPMTQETSIYCGMFMGFSGNIMEYQRISKSPKATPQYENISQHCFPPKGRDDYLGVIPAQFWRGKKQIQCWIIMLAMFSWPYLRGLPYFQTHPQVSWWFTRTIFWLNHSKSPKGQQGFWYWGEQLLSTLRPRKVDLNWSAWECQKLLWSVQCWDCRTRFDQTIHVHCHKWECWVTNTVAVIIPFPVISAFVAGYGKSVCWLHWPNQTPSFLVETTDQVILRLHIVNWLSC